MTRACAGRMARAPDGCMQLLNRPPTRAPRTLTTADTDIHAWHARRAAPPADRTPNVGAVLEHRAAFRAAGRAPGYASKRRKIVTAFWPPKPKPLIATVSSFASRATSGT